MNFKNKEEYLGKEEEEEEEEGFEANKEDEGIYDQGEAQGDFELNNDEQEENQEEGEVDEEEKNQILLNKYNEAQMERYAFFLFIGISLETQS